MVSPARVDKMITLEEFLRLPEIDLRGDPVLPGYRLPVAELFGWLTLRRPKSPPSKRRGPSTPGESTQ